MKKKSFFWTISKEKMTEIVNDSSSLADVIRYFGLRIGSANYETLKNRLDKDNIEYAQFIKKTINNFNKIPTENILVLNSSYDGTHLKKRLIKEEILKNICFKCGQLPEWNGEVLTLVLDHKNGNSKDHRIENIRLLCPNCDSQQLTYRGNNRRKKYYCVNCNKSITKHSVSGLCNKCSSIKMGIKNRRVERPLKEVLLQEVKEKGYSATGRKYGVSDNAIRKWLKMGV